MNGIAVERSAATLVDKRRGKGLSALDRFGTRCCSDVQSGLTVECRKFNVVLTRC